MFYPVIVTMCQFLPSLTIYPISCRIRPINESKWMLNHQANSGINYFFVSFANLTNQFQPSPSDPDPYSAPSHRPRLPLLSPLIAIGIDRKKSTPLFCMCTCIDLVNQARLISMCLRAAFGF